MKIEVIGSRTHKHLDLIEADDLRDFFSKCYKYFPCIMYGYFDPGICHMYEADTVILASEEVEDEVHPT